MRDPVLYRSMVKTHNLFSVNENLIEQCFATHIDQMLSTIFSNVVQPDCGWFRLNNAEQYCWQHWTMWATTLLIAVLSIQPWTGYSFFFVYTCNFSRVDECSSDRRGADFREDRRVCAVRYQRADRSVHLLSSTYTAYPHLLFYGLSIIVRTR